MATTTIVRDRTHMMLFMPLQAVHDRRFVGLLANSHLSVMQRFIPVYKIIVEEQLLRLISLRL